MIVLQNSISKCWSLTTLRIIFTINVLFQTGTNKLVYIVYECIYFLFIFMLRSEIFNVWLWQRVFARKVETRRCNRHIALHLIYSFIFSFLLILVRSIDTGWGEGEILKRLNSEFAKRIDNADENMVASERFHDRATIDKIRLYWRMWMFGMSEDYCSLRVYQTLDTAISELPEIQRWFTKGTLDKR